MYLSCLDSALMSANFFFFFNKKNKCQDRKVYPKSKQKLFINSKSHRAMASLFFVNLHKPPLFY